MTGRRVARLLTSLRPTDSPSEVYAKVAEQLPADVMLVFGPGIWRELRRELHSVEAIGQWAIGVAARAGRPVLLNVPDRNGSSHTLTIAPPGWTQEQLAGYVAARHEELADEYGPIERVRSRL